MSYPYKFALDAELNRRRVYDIVLAAIEKAAQDNNITQSKIAQTIGRKRSQVSTWLSGPSNWTFDTISDLLRSIDASMEYNVVFDVDRVASNIVHPASLTPDPSVIQAGTSSPLPSQSPATGVNGESLWLTNPPQQVQLLLPFPVSGISSTARYIPTPT